ncbi:MAG TPA: hypothetical protein ENJ93_03640 [Chloroflexi bacterium]|nr:hypothetical protein [Chloroflexota bacterium]
MFIQEAEAISATNLQLAGAFGFGMLIGWYVYYINRYRKGDVQFSDLSTVIGILGGGAVLALFPAKTDLFGAYGVGLAVGFFSYFAFLMLWVRISKNFNVDWFLDGRRKKLAKNEIAPDIRSTIAAMGEDEGEGFE